MACINNSEIPVNPSGAAEVNQEIEFPENNANDVLSENISLNPASSLSSNALQGLTGIVDLNNLETRVSRTTSLNGYNRIRGTNAGLSCYRKLNQYNNLSIGE